MNHLIPFKTAKSVKSLLEFDNNEAYHKLNKLVKGHKLDNGLCKDSIKRTSEYKRLKSKFNDSFEALRKFNAYFVKTYKSEILKERNNHG